MKSTPNLSFTDGQLSTGDLIFQKFSERMMEERNKQRRRITYGTSLVICVLLAALLVF
ncbi:MAG: hypothetical protein ABJ360_16330 [Roseobacter sp.]